MLILGSHVSFGKNQLLGSAQEAVSYGANTFMFYTGAPQNTIRKEINLESLQAAKSFMEGNHISMEHIVCHAPYIINLANKKDPTKWDFSINFLKQELKRCDELGVTSLVLHPGSAVSYTKTEALDHIVEALNLILAKEYRCKILLETMAGKGTECGASLEEIEYILKHVKGDLGVCLDTCHLNDSGVSIENFDSYLEEFDQRIGLDVIGCIHINDSKNAFASHKDRHANIGYGTIGFENLLHVIYHEKLQSIPKILETPYVGDSWEAKEKDYPPYRFEIAMIKEKVFDSNLLEHINEYYRSK